MNLLQDLRHSPAPGTLRPIAVRPEGGKLERMAAQKAKIVRDEVDDDPAAGERRKQAAKERAARGQAERLAAALARMKELEAERERREKTNKAEVAKQRRRAPPSPIPRPRS